MDKTKYIIIDKLALISVIVFAILLPFDMLYATIAIYPFIFFSIINLRKAKTIPKQFWIFCAVFLLSLSGYFYSSDKWKAGFLLERQLTIFLFPLLFPLAIEMSWSNVKVIMKWFTISCIGAIIYLLYNCFNYLHENNLPISFLSNSIFYNHSFSRPIHIHPGFLSLYLSIVIVFLIQLIPTISRYKKIVCIATILLSFIGLYFLASRNTIIATIIVIFFVRPFFIKRKRVFFLSLSFIVISVFLFLGAKTEYIHQRFSKEMMGDIQINQSNSKNYPESRIVRWKCATEIISKKPIFGYGTGDEIPELLKEYQKRKMWTSFFEEFNTHNQYLAILIKHGIVGLMIFMAILAYFFFVAIRNRNFLYFSFLFILFIGFFTENIIDANKGIFFFAFFNTLFGYTILNERKKEKELLYSNTI